MHRPHRIAAQGLEFRCIGPAGPAAVSQHVRHTAANAAYHEILQYIKHSAACYENMQIVRAGRTFSKDVVEYSK